MEVVYVISALTGTALALYKIYTMIRDKENQILKRLNYHDGDIEALKQHDEFLSQQVADLTRDSKEQYEKLDKKIDKILYHMMNENK